MLGNFEHQGQQFHKKFAWLTPALKNCLRARVSNQLKGPKPVQKEDRRSSIVFDHPMINPLDRDSDDADLVRHKGNNESVHDVIQQSIRE